MIFIYFFYMVCINCCVWIFIIKWLTGKMVRINCWKENCEDKFCDVDIKSVKYFCSDVSGSMENGLMLINSHINFPKIIILELTQRTINLKQSTTHSTMNKLLLKWILLLNIIHFNP